MPQISSSGKFILSAGEISEFCVCPESWRLRRVTGDPVEHHNPSVKLGKELHDKWARDYSDILLLLERLKVAACWVIAAILVYIFI